MNAQPASTKKVFFSGVLLLTLSTVLVKLVGLLYKIPMLSYLGSEGMGYFQSAYEIYAVFCIVATAGLPVALSILISAALARENRTEAESIWRVSLALFLMIGFIGSLLMLLLARPISQWIKSENAYACIVSISPTVFFICLSSAIRGYFQGFQRMLPTALSQLIEAVGKLIFGLLFAHLAISRGATVPALAAAAGWGVTLGTVVSTLYLIAERARFMSKETMCDSKRGASRSLRSIGKQLISIALPVTVGSFLVSLTRVIDMGMILRRLQSIGYTMPQANEAYGSYTTLALSVFGLLPTLLNSVSLPLIPILSSAIAKGDRGLQEHMVTLSYRLTAFISIPASFGVTAFGRPILTLLFGAQSGAIEIAAPLLSILGISVFLSSMITATNSILHAYQEVKKPILSTLVGVLIKGISAYFLIGSARIAILGAPISSFFCNSAIVLLNVYFVSRHCNKIEVRSLFLYPSLLAAIAVGIAYGEHLFLCDFTASNAVTTLIPIATAIVLYVLLGCLLGVFSREDILSLPLGKQIVRFLETLHLLPQKEFEKTEKRTCTTDNNMLK